MSLFVVNSNWERRRFEKEKISMGRKGDFRILFGPSHLYLRKEGKQKKKGVRKKRKGGAPQKQKGQQ